jgi:hypothetical protein
MARKERKIAVIIELIFIKLIGVWQNRPYIVESNAWTIMRDIAKIL